MPGKIGGLRNMNMAWRIVFTNWELCSYIGNGPYTLLNV